MNKFSSSRPIPPLFVNMELVKSLHSYLVEQAGKVSTNGVEVSIEIDDAFGTETNLAIDDGLPSRFSNSTSDVRVELSAYGPHVLGSTERESLRVAIKFKGFLGNDVNINYTGKDARALVASLHSGIDRILDMHTTGLRWLHPKRMVPSSIFFLSLWVFALPLFSETIPRGPSYVALPLILVTGYLYFDVLRSLRPRIEFDSNLTAIRRDRYAFLMKGIGTLALFTIPLLILREFLGS